MTLPDITIKGRIVLKKRAQRTQRHISFCLCAQPSTKGRAAAMTVAHNKPPTTEIRLLGLQI